MGEHEVGHDQESGRAAVGRQGVELGSWIGWRLKEQYKGKG